MFRRPLALGLATAALVVASAFVPTLASADALIPIRPDVRVTYTTHYRFMSSTIFKFDVKNIGTATADAVTFVGQCSYLEADGGYRNVNQFLGAETDFVRGETKEMVVTCEKDGPYAAKASLHAIVADDLNTANNRGHSPDPTKP